MHGQQEHTVRIREVRYLIFVPDGDAGEALAECLEYAQREHPEWTSGGVIVGHWTAVVTMLSQGLADVVLIAQRSHLPRDRFPRVVSVEEELAGTLPAPRDSRRPGRRRPHLS